MSGSEDEPAEPPFAVVVLTWDPHAVNAKAVKAVAATATYFDFFTIFSLPNLLRETQRVALSNTNVRQKGVDCQFRTQKILSSRDLFTVARKGVSSPARS